MSSPRSHVTTFDDSFALFQAYSSLRRQDERQGDRLTQRQWRGWCCTPQGIVALWSFHDLRGTGAPPVVYLTFVHAGRVHHRTVRGCGVSERALARLAGRFAREIATGDSRCR